MTDNGRLQMTGSEIIVKYKMTEVSDEGGHFVRTYTAPRQAGSCILYLLCGNERSCWHKLTVDEIWMYHSGSAAQQLLIFADGTLAKREIGPGSPQSVIPAGTWQTTRLTDPTNWGLFGTCCIPEFRYENYIGGTAEKLISEFPENIKQIKEWEK